MTNNSNEATKEFTDFFVQLATAFNKLFTNTDIQTWWKEFGYDPNNYELALESQRLLDKTYEHLISPHSGYFADAERAMFPSFFQFNDALSNVRRAEISEIRDQEQAQQLKIPNKILQDKNIKQNFAKLMSMVNRSVEVETKSCHRESIFAENGIKGKITTDDQGRSYVEIL